MIENTLNSQKDVNQGLNYLSKKEKCLANLIIDSLRLYFLIRNERVVDSPPGIIKPSDCFKSSPDLTDIEFNPIFLRRL